MKPGMALNSLSPKQVALDPELNDGSTAAVSVGAGTSHAVIQGTAGLTEERGMRHWAQLMSDTGPDSGQKARDVRCLNGIHVRDGSPQSSSSC